MYILRFALFKIWYILCVLHFQQISIQTRPFPVISEWLLWLDSTVLELQSPRCLYFSRSVSFVYNCLVNLTVTESKLTLLLHDKVLRQKIMTSFGKPADQEDGRLVSQNPSSLGRNSDSFYTGRGEGHTGLLTSG